MSKASFIVTGGTPLYGSVRVGGAKNASYKLMIAALLGSKESRLLNLPDISDVDMVAEIINGLGAKAYRAGERTFFIDTRNLRFSKINQEYGEKSRASTLFIPALLAKFGQAEVPMPGGDKIGKRPLERHMDGLELMGVKFEQENGMLRASCKELRGCNYCFEKNTHTGTETLIMAAVLAKGKTVLENAAEEPEIDDLISFLNQMGAKIRRRSFRKIEIDGVEKLGGAIHKIMPDRNEAVSYACAAIASRGDIVVENARQKDLKAFLEKLDEIGAGYEIGDYGIRFYYKGPMRAADVETDIHPGFMTDWQPLFATLLCQCHGESIIHETVMQNRFQYVEDLKAMGAKIEYFNPTVKNPEVLYNFNWQDHSESDRHAIKIYGPTDFKGGEFTIHDLRAGATILLAAIGAKDKTILHNIEQVERGYQKIDEKLIIMGAKIERITE
ncbi:MAG: UDP-N-acetylglucosamine 1-carboxyvinyltransferase [Candidatus Pacebacteria bacterium GW2011_GWF2_38_9]|nr:MAG: UDP-N-acetylglucosamine1-carboxyvinyltransferase, UDP-N-acetylglucosamine 1-carboxyvinyltransferase [candidate division TM6 bacterium GW2011_GWF2_28_16]KKQ88906.1 MAG: UDP-N-acetylglucosamine 1-carboxyvinyltransferase [Candidatus Pacebacteria bacterium GW2011_GWF2_38_9]HAZ73082.1 UDP-N-acetylglucosamine 1-carboxyvinyltransferase [Candidatus Paceibacterota bacterium]